MPRFRPVLLTLALPFAAGCETATDPVGSGPDLDPNGAVVSAGVIEKAAGTAFRFPLLPDGSTTTVRHHFNVTKKADGSVHGLFTYDQGGVSLVVDVTCMTVVDGNKAWIAGIIRESTIGFLGHVSYFYTFDNGEGAQDPPDTISLVRVETVPGTGEADRFCDELPQILPPRDVERGNVTVRAR